uniref:Urea-proton symporter DUR3 n=1 Tax=Pyramimonas obovata TaxID=1411642 RepID=A0A7S0R9W6_9CHLO
MSEYYSDYTLADGTVVCAKDKDFFGDTSLLSEGVGYAIVLGFGVFFSFLTSFMVFLEKRYVGVNISSEFFNTAGRDIKTGLTATVIVSQWTWAATLLQSSNVAWAYGVSGPFWYASGATIQVLLFGILAIELKRKAATAHTIAEIVDARWGPTAHKVALYFCFLTNIIVSAMLVLGGAATVNALTGMDIEAASFLIPMGVILYTMAGGLKATFLASYFHTAVIFGVLCLMVFIVYAGSDDLGSADKVYKFLDAVASSNRTCVSGELDDYSNSTVMMEHVKAHGFINVWDGHNCGEVSGNKDGSYLTMLSNGGLKFGIINIIGNFGTVFVDQSYWQSAIAAKPSSSYKGYLLGGLCWFAIPFALATAVGLASVALDLPVTAGEAGAGLVPPATAVHFMGEGGGCLMAIMLFMAITSTGSAEQIAVSSLFSYDIYRKYINPDATGEDILRVSRYAILAFGVFMGVLSIILYEIGLSLGFVYLMMGIFIGSAVVPMSLVLTWDKANANGAIFGSLIAQVTAIIVWVISAAAYDGEVNLTTLGKNDPMLIANLVAILFSGFIHITWSLIAPQNYDFSKMASSITLLDDVLPDYEEKEQNELLTNHAKRWITMWGGFFTVVMVIVWPILSVPAGVFSEGYFRMWVYISIIWGVLATATTILLPIWESRVGIMTVIKGLFFNDDLHYRLDDIDYKMDLVMDHLKIPRTGAHHEIGSSFHADPAFRAKLLSEGAKTTTKESVTLMDSEESMYQNAAADIMKQ